jgi:tRNA (guanine-N7-)-methyltransferase
MSPMRLRQHVNPLHAHFAEFRGRVPALEADRPIEIEIGCAEAQFLFERARQDPGRQYVGLEIREELVHWVNRHAEAAGLPVVAVFCQAQLHLPLIFTGHQVDRVYLNFPDPWFKRKHHNRRMIDDQLATAIAAVTRAGAEIFVQSDVWEVALDAMEVFERRDEWFCNQSGDWTFWRGGNRFGARSWREQNAEETGLPIWRILYHRRG